MARIAGIVSSGAAERSPGDVHGMLETFARPGSTAAAALGPACVGAIASNPGACVAARGPLLAVVDGAIYNAADLGSRHAGPAEQLIDLVERQPVDAVLSRVNGDFAAAIFDRASGTLWLARDRVGVKPLYYHARPDRIVFGSQPRALLADDTVPRGINAAFAARFAGLHYRQIDNAVEQSPFQSIAQLPAAHLLEWRASGTASLRRYWSLEEQPDVEGSEHELAEEYRSLLLDAVRVRLRAARAPAFTLSGGMDSSSVLASAARVSGTPQPALSTVYQDATYDESNEIRSMLTGPVADWQPVAIGTPDVFALVDRMVRVHDEPVATATWLSHFLLCEAAAGRGHGALFGGLGGDELNAGEYEYFFFHFADLRRAGREDALAGEVACWATHHDHPIYRKNMAVAEDGLRRLVDLDVPGRCLVDRARMERYLPAMNPEFHDLRGFDPVMDHPFRSYLRNRTYQDIFRETAPCCLRAEDRQTDAFGLDHFDPFFDHRLVEFMFRVPGDLKIRRGVTKILLREATKGLLPEETRTRIKKTGWNAPAHVWFSGRSLDGLRDLVASQRFRERGIYDVPAVERIIGEHARIVDEQAPRENHMMFLWQLVNLNAWLDAYDHV